MLGKKPLYKCPFSLKKKVKINVLYVHMYSILCRTMPSLETDVQYTPRKPQFTGLCGDATGVY
jgi:hypothetical protein